jgi:carboxypeptidase Taq
MNGTLSAKDAPLLWNKKYKEYLGLDVPSDKMGILQDVHWSDGSFGYFPSYALGNLYGAIIYERMKEELDIDGLLRTGNLIPIREWFAKNDFAYNYLPAKLWLNKVTGKEVSAEQFIAYLERKYS